MFGSFIHHGVRMTDQRSFEVEESAFHGVTVDQERGMAEMRIRSRDCDVELLYLEENSAEGIAMRGGEDAELFESDMDAHYEIGHGLDAFGLEGVDGGVGERRKDLGMAI